MSEQSQISRRDFLIGAATLLTGTILSRTEKSRAHASTLGQFTPKRIYLAPDDHTDYFWTAGEDAYRQAFLEMIDYYLDRADATAANPSDFQSRWNCDGSFWIWTYEKNRTSAQFQRLIDRIRDGHLSFPLNALVVCLGGAPAEAVLRGMYYAGTIERRFDLRVPVAISMENQTLPYGLAALWAGSGAQYSWKGICNCGTQVTAAWDRQHEIYWIEGPDGSRMLMKWNSMLTSNQSMGGYAEARYPASIVDYVDTDPGFVARFPYRVIGAFGQGWDDFKTMDQAFVSAAQTKTNASRRVIVSNQHDFFRDFEATYGAGLPTVACSFGNEWDLHCAALAEVSARVKRAVEKLRGAEALATLVSLQDPAFMSSREEARDRAWMDLGLFWEHNFGMVSPPSGLVNERVAWQRRLAGEIEDYVNTLEADATSALGGMIQKSGSNLRFYAFNPLSWERTDVADFPYTGTVPVHVIDLSNGQEVPSQLVVKGTQQYLRVLAQDVPSVGYKVFEVRSGEGQSFPGGPGVDAGSGVIQNNLYEVTLAPRGAITSLKDKGRGNRQFARNIGGYYINDLGSSSGSLTIENAGPVSATLKATAASPLAHVTRITLFRDGVNRIEIQNDINQNFDATHAWRFGFELSSPDVWHEEVGAVIRARLNTQGGHYSARTGNSRYDWLTLNHFADMSGDGAGVTLSNADCYFMKLGTSTVSSLDTSTPQISALAGGRVANSNNGLPSQGGDNHFLQRFALQTHDTFDAVQAMKFALAHQNPLVTGEVTGGSAYPETAYSLVSLSDPRVLLWALKPADDGLDQGFIVRLWNLAANSTILWLGLANGPIGQAWHLSHVETPIAAAPVTAGELVAELAGNQIKTYSLLPSGGDWQALSAPTGVSASDGTYAYWVRVAWDAVEGATGYEVWRNTNNDLGSAELLAPSIHGTVYGDTSCAPEQICHYWVRAKNAYSTSAFSVPDSGWKRLPLPTDTLILMPIITK